MTKWSVIICYRYVYLDHINGRLQKHEPDSQDSADLEADDIFLDTKLRLKLKMAESCKEQNNFTLTLRILKETHSVSIIKSTVYIAVWGGELLQ